MFIAHINQSGEKQSLDEHLQGVAESCALSAKKLGLSNTARLAGLLHDMGKVSSRFTDYILYSHSHPGDQTLRGKVIHSTQGAKYIYNEYGQDQALDRLTSSIIAALIAGHHGGLMDCVSPEGEQPLFDRITSEDPRLDYDEVKNKFTQSCSQYPEIASLLAMRKMR
jgi:CRISPR-associated endonuclease/helicase Cas3